jgi:hypothetical protein
MSELLKVQYEKNNATFVDGNQAYADKNSLFPTELTDAIVNSSNAALAAGVLLEPFYYEWDQTTFTLTVNKHVTSQTEFNEIRVEYGYNGTEAVDFAALAGWTYLGIIVTEIV